MKNLRVYFGLFGLVLLTTIFSCQSEDQMLDESPISELEIIDPNTLSQASGTTNDSASHGVKVKTGDPFAK